MNHVLTFLNTLTAKATIKPTQISVCSESISSIENSIQESTRSFTKAEDNQFVQLWIVTKYDYEKYQKYQDIFTEHL